MTSVSPASSSTRNAEPLLERQSPWSPEAEQAVLGAMLLDADAALKATGAFLTPDDRRTLRKQLSAEYEPTAGILGQIADRLFVERTVERDLDHSLANFKALVETKLPALV